jgi:hypothetical protein
MTLRPLVELGDSADSTWLIVVDDVFTDFPLAVWGC